MKPFRFPLQRVLDVKSLLEREQRLRVANAQQQAAAAEEAAARAMSLRSEAVRAGNNPVLSANPMLRTMSWRQRERLRVEWQRQEARAEEGRRQLAHERTLLIGRRRERRMLETLQNKQRQHHRMVEERRTQAAVDDLFNTRFGRQGREDDDA